MEMATKFLSFHSKETPDQYTEVYHRIFISALFRDMFWLEILSYPSACIFVDIMIRHSWGDAILLFYETMINMRQ